MAGTSPMRGFTAFEQQQQPQQQAQATEGPQAFEVPTPGTPPPQRHNIGTPGVESGDVQVIIEQMHQMMAMLKEQLAALEKKAKPTAAAGPSDGEDLPAVAEDPFRRGDPWQRPVTGPPGMPGAARFAGNPGGGQTGGGAESGFNTVHAHEASAPRQPQADVMRTNGHPGPKPLDRKDIEKPNK